MPRSWPASTCSPANRHHARDRTTPTSSVSAAPSTSCTPRSAPGADEPPVPLPADLRLLARAEILNLTTDAGDLDITTQPDGTHGYEDLKQARPPLATRRRPLHHDRLTARHHPQQNRRWPGQTTSPPSPSSMLRSNASENPRNNSSASPARKSCCHSEAALEIRSPSFPGANLPPAR